MNRRPLVTGAVLVVLAAGLRAHGIGWGLPQVYEEAVPLKIAWMMWGWGPLYGFDLNPHFFNYPSLVIYLQFLGQALLLGVLWLLGPVRSVIDFQTLYILDPTAFYIMGRGVTALLGVGAVAAVFALGFRVGGLAVGIPAGLLLAINPAHISASQMISVDVPLTCFVTLTLLYSVTVLGSPTLRNFLLAGLFLGLATATKYTGAVLVLAILTGFLVARSTGKRRGGKRPSWRYPTAAFVLGGAVFLLTSPFVVLDHQAFLKDLSFEREHMALGHFGLSGAPTWRYYLESFDRTLGWPALAAGMVGLIYLGAVRRVRWTFPLAAFLIPYLIMVSSWSMRADRYLLPAVAVVFLLAAGLLGELARLGKFGRLRARRRAVVVAGLTGLLAVPVLAAFPAHLQKLRPDTRTEAKKWIEANLPRTGFVALEFLGPELFTPSQLWPLHPELKEKVMDPAVQVPLYASVKIPLFQSTPEQAAVFYDLDLYREADLVVTSSSVKSRYLNEPQRFSRQVAFYRDLEREFEKVMEFDKSQGMTGPTIAVYRNPGRTEPFGRRSTMPKPAYLKESEVNGKEASFYYSMGLNFETWDYLPSALESYNRALYYPMPQPSLALNVFMGASRCLMRLGREEDARAFMDTAVGLLPPDDQVRFVNFRRWLTGG